MQQKHIELQKNILGNLTQIYDVSCLQTIVHYLYCIAWSFQFSSTNFLYAVRVEMEFSESKFSFTQLLLAGSNRRRWFMKVS